MNKIECPKGEIKMKYENVYCQVSNYNTDALQKTLLRYGEQGFKLVNTMMAKNKYGVNVMYLFFTKEVNE